MAKHPTIMVYYEWVKEVESFASEGNGRTLVIIKDTRIGGVVFLARRREAPVRGAAAGGGVRGGIPLLLASEIHERADAYMIPAGRRDTTFCAVGSEPKRSAGER